MMNELVEESEILNKYAHNVKGELVYIMDVPSGRRGYFCRGCKQPMQAVKSNIQQRESYFRHDPKDVEVNQKCTYANETARHSLAKQILQRIKEIKVPAIYAASPDGKGMKMFISPSHTIKAHRVEIEMHFYENDQGEIKWGRGEEVDTKYLQIVPDITFFNEKGLPILFIEVVATHKITLEKRVKLKRLGIDTIQVSIPNDSSEAIESTFFTTKRTLWVYNNERENTQYVSVSNRVTTEISYLDELQAEFFKESFACRVSEIRNIIRSIGRCVGSEHYRITEQSFRSELSRVAANTESDRERLRKLQDYHRAAIISKYAARREQIRSTDERISGEENEHQAYHCDLEERYRKKAGEIETEQADIDDQQQRIDAEIKGTESATVNSSATVEERRREIERAATAALRAFEERRRELEADQASQRSAFEKEARGLDDHFGREDEVLSAKLKHSRKAIQNLRREIHALPSEFNENERTENSEIKRIDEETEGLAAEFESNLSKSRAELESKFDILRNEFSQRARQGDFEGFTTATRQRATELYRARGILNDRQQIQDNYRRYRKAVNLFKEGAFQDWVAREKVF